MEVVILEVKVKDVHLVHPLHEKLCVKAIIYEGSSSESEKSYE
jgi:hypothetical protein